MQFSVPVTRDVGCLDDITERLGRGGVEIESLACLCREGDGVATFSVPEGTVEQDLGDLRAEETGISVLQVKVPNEAGCLSQVTSAFSRAGVTIGSLACACSRGDISGTVAVGLVEARAAGK